MDLQNKVIIITGASSGIGREIARTLTSADARLVLAARTRENLEKVAAELQFDPLIVPTDVTVEADCRALIETVVENYGRLDVLINNAGYGPPASLVDTTEELWNVTIDACLKSVYLMSRAAVPVMLEQGGGTIVNISSVAGKLGFANRTAYCAAKWGVQGFTAALRAELSEQNIRAHAICPAAVATEWWDNVGDNQSQAVMQGMVKPEEVAEAVHYVLKQPGRIQIDEVVIKTYRSPWEVSEE